MSLKTLREIENRLDFLSSLSKCTSEQSIYQIETEIDYLISKLTKAHKRARIEEIGLKVISS